MRNRIRQQRRRGGSAERPRNGRGRRGRFTLRGGASPDGGLSSMMRFHPRSAAIVLGGALALAAATSAPALAQKHTQNSSHSTTSGHKGSSQHGTSAHGHNA